MRNATLMRFWVVLLAICGGDPRPTLAADNEREGLAREFSSLVRPFLQSYCADCHGGREPEAKFDLSPYQSFDSVTRDLGHWELILRRVRAKEMPPEDAEKLPDSALRQRLVEWIERVRHGEAAKNAGDPGPVLARRLSNAEYDYTIHDLTGVDIRPTREFPVDPANEAGFDNSGESLAMSPALLNKYLAAARQVADHLVFLPRGLEFAPHPVVVYSDRDKYAVHRIVDFYRQQPVDYAAYFVALWRYRYRVEWDMPGVTLSEVARAEKLSGKYLQQLWELLTDTSQAAGPVAELRERWNQLPAPASPPRLTDEVSSACSALRDWVVATREHWALPVSGNFDVEPLNRSCQPLILWKNRSIAANRRVGKLPDSDRTPEGELLRDSVARFCSIFPDKFYVSERGRMFLDPKEQEKGRLLSAGFHLMLGYFRDDAPLYDLILDSDQQKRLDALWAELDFSTRAPVRQFSDFVYFERAEKPGFLKAPEFDFAREDSDVTSEAPMQLLAQLYLAKAREAEVGEPVLQVIAAYFQEMSLHIRRLERSLADAEPRHLESLWSLVERAWRRPLVQSDREELLVFYRSLRDSEGLSHEDAIRDTLVSVLVSPWFGYRTTTVEPDVRIAPLSDHELASRLSYFLWSSLPDQELAQQAAAGRLHEPDVLRQQTRRMLQDPRIRRLATEFGGNWLEFRRFESHHGVNRDRFPNFTHELRQAMFEEPIYFFTDLIQRNGSVFEFLEADHTFVNSVLAEHYGMPWPEDETSGWRRMDAAGRFGRGGLLPMSVFLTQNSPGLRTSPVKRGYWVVRRLLGEQIPPPPPEVAELPESETELGERSLREVLAQHRESNSCAGCHRRFDSLGLVFEGYGPVGERRLVDLGNRPVETTAEFPDGSVGEGVEGLLQYLRSTRQKEFLDNLCRKLLSFALGRSLMLSDELTLLRMQERLSADGYRFNSLVETIVSSPQFLNKRGQDFAVAD